MAAVGQDPALSPDAVGRHHRCWLIRANGYGCGGVPMVAGAPKRLSTSGTRTSRDRAVASATR